MTASMRLRGRHIAKDRQPNGESFMFCGVLDVNQKSDQVDNYLGMAKMLLPELEKIDGFVIALVKVG
jgi:hypothetical protein